MFAPKQGKDPSDPLNYCPISLLEVLARVFERFLLNRLLLHLEYNDFLTSLDLDREDQRFPQFTQ